MSARAAVGGPPRLVAAASLLLLYVGSAAFAYEFAVTPGAGLSVWYPPPGILLVALHRYGLVLWPVAILAEVAVGAWIYDIGDEFGAGRLVLNAVLVTGAYLVGGLVLDRLRFDDRFGRRRDLAAFVLAAFLVAAPLAAIAGTAMQRWAGVEESGPLRAMAGWWVGDAIGMLVLAPVALLLTNGEVRASMRRTVAAIDPLAVGQAIAVVGMPLAVFAWSDDPYRHLYAPLLPVVLVAARRGAGPSAFAVLGAVLGTTIAASQADGGTVGRYDLQLLLAVLAVTGHALGMSEKLRTGAVGRHAELAALIDATSDVVAVVDADGVVDWANPAGRRLLGAEPGESLGLDDGAVATALRRGSWRGSAKTVGPDGDDVRLSQLLVALPGTADRPKVGIVARDVTDLHRVSDQLTRMAFVDQLTGLANRARLGERLGYALGAGGDEPRHHGVALIDIDRFAILNDRLGRDAGNAILQEVASRLEENVRGGELLVRMGDDRFGVLLEDIPDTYSAVAVAERLRAAACGPLGPEYGHAVITASAGVVVGERGDDTDIVLRRADLALQRAKQSGGATTTPYDPAMAERLERRIDIEGKLRAALAGDGWPLRYQPMVDLTTGAIVSCEALLEPIFPPLEVVDVAEELSLIGELGHQVLVHAVAQAVRWRQRLPHLRMSVNVSAQQLLDPMFPEQVDRVIRAAGLPPQALVLEITETVFADDRIEAAITATMLQGMGIRIAVDDFGTGFSSLSRLRAMPVDELKVDRAFVADLGRLSGADAIVAAVVALGAARHLDVIAEGIETAEQRDILRSVGCGYGQGWLFAKPVAPPLFDELLDQYLVDDRALDVG
jgi:diguanylate cyclase (GGDEF)-like protein